MKLDQPRCKQVLGAFLEMGVISKPEIDNVMDLFAPTFPWAASLAIADSIHVHLRVDDVTRLPHDRILALGTTPENQKDGYVKFPFSGGLNVILSSIDVAEDDRIPGHGRTRPYLDHIGVDLRDDSAATKQRFDETPAIANTAGWRHKSQGGDGTPVYCCHVEVGAKHWVYSPTAGAPCIEFAFGALILNGDTMGCDLRPIDPAHPKANQAVCR